MSIKNQYSAKSWKVYYYKIEPKLSKTVIKKGLSINNGTLCVDETEVCSFIFDVKCIKKQVFENETIETIVMEVCQIDPDCNGDNLRVSEPEIYEIDRSQKGKPANFSKILGAKYVIYDEKVFKDMAENDCLCPNSDGNCNKQYRASVKRVLCFCKRNGWND